MIVTDVNLPSTIPTNNITMDENNAFSLCIIQNARNISPKEISVRKYYLLSNKESFHIVERWHSCHETVMP